MSRSLTTILITLGLIVSAAGAYAPAAHAQTATSPASSVQTTTAGANNPIPLPTDPGKNAGFGAIMTWIMGLFAWLLGIAILLLDNVVFYTVVTMGTYVNHLSAVGIAWRVLRDVGNIVLIFGFLAIGISTILNTNRLGYGTHMLPMLLVAAVFLNFSLFISEAIIDTGNLFATEFYTQINGGSPPTAPNFTSANISNEGISNKIMSQLGFQSIYGSPLNHPADLSGSNSWIIGFMGIILFMVAAFVMFSLAFVLITRFVILILLIIVAPIGFAGLAVPKLTGMAKQWWGMLFEQTITAPVLLLLLYIALKVITDASFLTGFSPPGSSSGANAWTGYINNANLTGFGSVMLSFIVAMGLLLAVVISAKKMSASGAGWATKTAGAATFGVAAWGANRTVGRGAYYLRRRALQSQTFNRIDAATGRVTSRALGSAATASYDVRSSKAFKNLPFGGIAAGEAAKGGFAGARKRSIEEQEKAAKAIEEAHKEALRPNTKEQERIDIANKAHEAAVGAHNEVKTAHEKVVQEEKDTRERVKQDKAEVERLTKVDSDNRNKGVFDPKATNDLKAAQQKLGESEQRLATTTAALATAAETLKQTKDTEIKAEKEKIEAEKAPNDRMTASIKENKKAYAEGLENPNLIGFVINGPASGAAARKIKASLKEKGDNDKVIALLKKMNEAEQAEKKKGGEGEEKPKEENKPEAGH